MTPMRFRTRRFRVFQIALKSGEGGGGGGGGGGGESEILLTGFFLLGDGNLMKSDFDHSNFFLTAFFKY